MRRMFAASVCVFLVAIAGCGGSRESAPTASRGEGNAAPERSFDAGSTSTDASDDAIAYTSSAPAEPSAGSEAPSAPVGADAATRENREMPLVDSSASTPARKKPEMQSGTLTAGSFDDVANQQDFRSFLSTAMQHDPQETLPRIPSGPPVVIQVIDGQRRPVGGATLRVASKSQRTQSASLMTASDGRVMYLSGIDGAAAGAFDVTVQSSASSSPATFEMHVGQTPWTIQLPDEQAQLPQRLDLALVVDTTGSMGDELEYLKVEIDSISQSIKSLFPNVDQRLALIVYRDEGDDYVFRKYDFTSSLREFRRQLDEQFAAGGGDYPEAMDKALGAASQLSWREGNVARALFLIADAPPHDAQLQQSFTSIEAFRTRGVRLFPVAASGVQLKAEYLMRSGAYATMGQYLFLTDHSGIGNPHAKPHVPSYQVERLDQLMIRMIASELAGQRLAPKDVLAIERGDREHEMPLVPGPQQQSAAPVIIHEPTCGAPDNAGNLLQELWLLDLPKYSWLIGVAALLAIGFVVDTVQKRLMK